MSSYPTVGRTVALPAPPSGWFDYSYAVLMDGRLALIRTQSDVEEERRRWWHAVIDADSQGQIGPEHPDFWSGGIRLSIFDGIVETDVVEVPSGHVIAVDRLPDGRWLVVSVDYGDRRTHARLYASDGSAHGEIFLGEGIEELRCSPDGTIWVGFSEQTIFDPPDENGVRPVSAGGLVQFDQAGKVLWSFEVRRQADLAWARIFDCPSFTLTGAVLWACLPDASQRLEDLPSTWIRVEGGNLSWWAGSPYGERAVAVSGDLAMATGFDFHEANRITVERLDDAVARSVGGFRFDPVVTAGRALLQYPGDRMQFVYGFDTTPHHGAKLLQGRDGVLHVVQGGLWSRISAEDAVKAVDPLDDTLRSRGPPIFVKIYPRDETNSFGESFFAPPLPSADHT